MEAMAGLDKGSSFEAESEAETGAFPPCWPPAPGPSAEAVDVEEPPGAGAGAAEGEGGVD